MRLSLFIAVLCCIGVAFASQNEPLRSDVWTSADSLQPVSFPVSECEICEAAVILVRGLIELNYTLAEMEGPFISFCSKFVFPNAEHPMCPGVISAYAPPVIFVLSSVVLSPTQVCTGLRVCKLFFESHCHSVLLRRMRVYHLIFARFLR